MKAKLLNLAMGLTTAISFAQVGIGTLTPQATLHVAGANSTIRIESLDAVNSPTLNDGVKIAPLYVTGNGDISLAGNGFGTSSAEPLNFLIDVPNFIDDDPYGLGFGSGTVVNSNDSGETLVEGEIARVTLSVPQDATVEVKYGITLLVSGVDITTGALAYVVYDEAVSMQTYFSVDIDSNGLDATEKARRHGYKGQCYETNYGGSIGYPYMNSQGYLTLPAGTHELYFFGVVNDDASNYTSIGFGGDKDYLKIRVYN